MKHKIALFLLLALPAFTGVAEAYNPLRLNARTVYPEEVVSVGDAARYLVEGVGYRLVTRYPAPAESARIAQQALSPLAKNNKVMAIEEALLLVIGESNRLVVDHAHKLISFEYHTESPAPAKVVAAPVSEPTREEVIPFGDCWGHETE